MNRVIAFVIALVVADIPLMAQISKGAGGLVQNTSLSGDNPTDGFLRSVLGFGAF